MIKGWCSYMYYTEPTKVIYGGVECIVEGNEIPVPIMGEWKPKIKYKMGYFSMVDNVVYRSVIPNNKDKYPPDNPDSWYLWSRKEEREDKYLDCDVRDLPAFLRGFSVKNQTEELREKYATGKYDAYWRAKPEQLDSDSAAKQKWIKHSGNIGFTNSFNDYKLILKEHSHIADAVISNPDIKVEFNGYLHGHRKWCEENDFFNMYEEEAEYRLKERPKKVSEDVSSFASRVYDITNNIGYMLIEKNKKYGNSALEPRRIFSKMDALEQLKVRIDDKLSRISNQNVDEDEDVVDDLLGYLVLYKIAKGKV